MVIKCTKCGKNTNFKLTKNEICFKCYNNINLKIHIAASDLPIKRGWIKHFQGWVLAPSYASWVN